MQAAAETHLPISTGQLTEALANPGDRRHFMRVVVDDAGHVASAGTQASHHLSSVARSNGLVEVPSRTTLPAGAAVTVLRWDR